MTGMMQHVHPISTQLHEQIERGIGGLLTVGGLRHETAELGRPGDRIEIIPGVGPDGDQTAEGRIGEVGAHRLPECWQAGQAGGQGSGVTGAIEHQIEGVQIRLCADPGLGFHVSLQVRWLWAWRDYKPARFQFIDFTTIPRTQGKGSNNTRA